MTGLIAFVVGLSVWASRVITRIWTQISSWIIERFRPFSCTHCSLVQLKRLARQKYQKVRDIQIRQRTTAQGTIGRIRLIASHFCTSSEVNFTDVFRFHYIIFKATKEVLYLIYLSAWIEELRIIYTFLCRLA